TFVNFEVLGHRTIGRYLLGPCIGYGIGEGEARQVVYAVCRAKGKRWPAVLPGTARLGRLVQHHEIAPRRQPQLLEVEGRRKPGLTRADYGDARLINQLG